MMKQKITMTIDIKISSASDLSVDNEVMNLSRMHLPAGNALAGVSWLVADCPAYESLLAVLKFVFGLIEEKLSGYRLWLLIGNSAWQSDTRIVRYYKLWGALKARGIEISHASCAQEVMRESEGKLKFFGAMQLSKLSVGSTIKALLDERCAYIVAIPSNLEPQDILEVGWYGDFAEDSIVIDYLINNGGLLIKRVGAFDDKEWGMVAVGQPELVKRLLS